MADDLEKIKKDMDELGKSIDSLISIKPESKKLRDDLDDVLKDPLMAADAWEKAADNKKQELIKKVREDLPKRLDVLMRLIYTPEKKQACAVTITGIVLLVLLSGLYLILHSSSKIPIIHGTVSYKFFADVGSLKGLLHKKDITYKEISDGMDNIWKERDESTPPGDVLEAQFRGRMSFMKGVATTMVQNEKADEKDPRLVMLREEIDSIDKEARALLKNDDFFWTVSPWRWLEIVFWGEFGVIIGILVWVCTQTLKGKYTAVVFEREKYWYLAEAFIGPIVVIAVFFLLKQVIGTVLSGVAETEVRGSIYLTLGLSFTLGYFIRRTLGIFNFIKDKLPVPEGAKKT